MAASRNPLKLISGNAHTALAERLARELGVPLDTAEVGAFADGEARIHLRSDMRGTDVFIVQPTCTPVNDHLMVLALMADAARAAGAARITAVIPYFGYARQELRSHAGDARSAQVAARILHSVGVDHVVVLDLHAPALESAFPMPITQVPPDSVFVPLIRSWAIPDLVIVSPDAGAFKRAQRIALALNARLAAIAKDRPRPDAVAPMQVLGDVKNRQCVVVDDMASTGRTLAGAAEALRAAGARDVNAVFTHPVIAPGAEERLKAARFGRIASTDTLPTSAPWLEIVPIAPLLASAIRELRGQQEK